MWMIIVGIVIVILVAAYVTYTYFPSYLGITKTTTTTTPTTVSTPAATNTTQTVNSTLTNYITYNYRYLDGAKSGGKKILDVARSNSSLDCSNRCALQKGCVGANWSSTTLTCSLMSSLLPIGEDSTTTLLVKDSADAQLDVFGWQPSDGIANEGELFCSDILANSTLAKSLCASIPECGGFTLELNNNSYPRGCIKMNSSTYPSRNYPTLAPNITTYLGNRADAIIFNQPNDTSNLNYRFGSVASGPQISSDTGLTLTDCAAKLNTDSSNTDPSAPLIASYNSIGGGCIVQSSVGSVTKLRNSTIIFSNLLSGYERYSNNWDRIDGIDFPNSNGGMAVKFEEAFYACMNSSYDTLVNISGLWYLRSSSSSSQSSNGNAVAYKIPSTFR